MEPVTLAVATSAVSSLAMQVFKGIASAAGKDAWGKIKGALSMKSDPEPEDLARSVAEAIEKHPEAAKEIAEQLAALTGGGAKGGDLGQVSNQFFGQVIIKNQVTAQDVGTIHMQ